MTSQQWWNDMRVLTREDDVRRPTPAPDPSVPAPRWGDVTPDRITRVILDRLDRLGFSNEGVIGGYAYLRLDVGPRPVLVALVVDEDDPRVVTGMVCGQTRMTAVQAARWLDEAATRA